MKIIIGMIVLIVIINIANYFKSESNPKKTHHSHAGHSHEIPAFEAKCLNGQRIKNSDFKGKRLYLQLVNAIDSEDYDLFNKVYSDFKDEDLEFVLFTDHPDKRLNNMNIDMNKVHIVGENYDHYRTLFRSPRNIGSWFLCDATGRIIDAGRNSRGYEDGPKLKLYQLMWNEFFNISEFIDHTGNLRDVEWLAQVKEVVQQDKSALHLFFLSVNLCEQCGGGKIIDNLLKIHSQYKGTVRVTAISYTHYSDQDIDALRSQSGITFPILFAEGRFLEKWDSMIKRFNRKTLDNILFTTDGSGKIYNIMFSGCKCFNDFFAATNQRIKERNK